MLVSWAREQGSGTVAIVISPELLARAREVLAGRVRRTPVLDLDGADLGLPGAARLTGKLELCQHGGSFKTRGAFAHLLLREVPAAGVVAASGGNHGAAVAFAAMTLGVPATVFVPEISNPAKVARIREYGADLVVTGARYADAREAAAEHQRRTGALDVPAFDAVETIAAQATLGEELAEQAPQLDTVLVPVGGGGLIAGIATAYADSPTLVVGVEPDKAPTLRDARAAGEPVDAPAGGVAADSLAPRRIGELTFAVCRDHVGDVVTVEDEAIVEAQALIWRELRLIIEPAAAVTVAALASGAYPARAGERVGIVLSGANLDPSSLSDTPVS